jgi:regulator of replication initiation timing
MKNIYDVLKQKEAQIEQLQAEIEALKVAARLLADDDEVLEVPRNSGTAVAGTPLASVTRMSTRDNSHTAWDATNKQFP